MFAWGFAKGCHGSLTFFLKIFFTYILFAIYKAIIVEKPLFSLYFID